MNESFGSGAHGPLSFRCWSNIFQLAAGHHLFPPMTALKTTIFEKIFRVDWKISWWHLFGGAHTAAISPTEQDTEIKWEIH